MAKNKSYNKLIAGTMTAAMVAGVVAPVAASAEEQKFTDVPAGQWYTDAINAMAAKGIISGKGDGTFGLGENVTRAQVATFMVKAKEIKVDDNAKPSFTDVAENNMYKKFIAAAEANKIMSGIGGGNFGPDKELTRVEMAQILVNAYGFKADENNKKSFDDIKDLTWGTEAIETLASLEIVKGDGKNFNPHGVVTREQAAQFIFNAMNHKPEVKEVKLEEVKAVSSKKLEVKFNKAVDTDKAKFDLKKDGFKSNYSSITWNADKTVATVELTSKIAKGEYTVSVTGLAKDALTGSVKTEDEKVAGIEILADVAPATADKTEATVGYKITNQYGEDVTKLNASSLTVSAANADSATTNADGSITIKKAAAFKEGDKVVLTLINGATATTTTKTVTISAATVASDATIGAVYNKDGKTLNQDVNLAKDKFYLPVTVKDQYGKEITDLKRLNGDKSEVLVTNTNPAVAEFGEFEKQTINGKEVTVLPVKKVVSSGETNVIVIAKASGKNAQAVVKVEEGVRADVVTLGAPSKVVTAGSEILFPLSVLDKQGNAIKNTAVLKGSAGIKLTGAELVEKDGELYAKVKGEDVKENTPVTVVVTSATGKVATQTVIPKAGTTPKVITGLNSKVSTAIREQAGAKVEISAKDLVVEDQFGQVISADDILTKLGTEYKIVAETTEDAPFTVTGELTNNATDKVVVTYKAGQTKTAANVTFKLAKKEASGFKNQEASAYSKQFTVVKDSSFASYKVEDIKPIYVTGTENSYAIPENYDKDIVVKAVTGEGSEVKLTAGTDYTVKSAVLTNASNDAKIDGADAAKVKFAKDAKTTTAKVTITINATGEEIVKEVTFSNEAPKVEKVTLVEDKKAADYIAGKTVKEVTVADFNKAAAFNIAELYNLADIVATDQYGVMATVAESGSETGTAKFANVATTAATLTLSKVSGDLTFADNGTAAASVVEISENGAFNVRVNLAGVSATPVKVTAKQAFSQKGSAAALAEAKAAAKTKIETAETAVNVSKTTADKKVTDATDAKTAADAGADETAKADAAKALADAQALQTKVNAEVAKVADAKTAYDKATTVEAVNAEVKKAEDAATAAANLVK